MISKLGAVITVEIGGTYNNRDCQYGGIALLIALKHPVYTYSRRAKRVTHILPTAPSKTHLLDRVTATLSVYVNTLDIDTWYDGFGVSKLFRYLPHLCWVELRLGLSSSLGTLHNDA